MRLVVALAGVCLAASPALAGPWTIAPPPGWTVIDATDQAVDYREPHGTATLHVGTQLWDFGPTRVAIDLRFDALVAEYVPRDKLVSTRRWDLAFGRALDLVVETHGERKHFFAIAVPEGEETRMTIAVCTGDPAVVSPCDAALVTLAVVPELASRPIDAPAAARTETNPFVSVLEYGLAIALGLLVIFAWARREQRRIRERQIDPHAADEYDEDEADVL